MTEVSHPLILMGVCAIILLLVMAHIIYSQYMLITRLKEDKTALKKRLKGVLEKSNNNLAELDALKAKYIRLTDRDPKTGRFIKVEHGVKTGGRR